MMKMKDEMKRKYTGSFRSGQYRGKQHLSEKETKYHETKVATFSQRH